jgi:hypothetical protein
MRPNDLATTEKSLIEKREEKAKDEIIARKNSLLNWLTTTVISMLFK